MRQLTPRRQRAAALLWGLVLVGGACDLMLLIQPAPVEPTALLSAKYPLAVAVALAAQWTRRLLARAHDACLEDLHD